MTAQSTISVSLALNSAPVLDGDGLSVAFETARRRTHSVSDVSFDVDPGEVFAIVGESGSGKSVTALNIMGLIPSPPASVSGSVRYEVIGLDREPPERDKVVGLSPGGGPNGPIPPDRS